jgi:hypothetical protein
MRELLKKYEKQTKVAAIILIIAAVSLFIWSSLSGGPSNASKAYYTTDDGQTTFTDDFFKAYPFDHNGKPAYRAYMFQTSAGKQYVAYLERYTPSGINDLQALLAKSGNREQLRDQIQPLRMRDTEVKAPNDPNAKWYHTGSARADHVTAANPPAGETVMMIFP